jgi:hypothetical protein
MAVVLLISSCHCTYSSDTRTTPDSGDRSAAAQEMKETAVKESPHYDDGGDATQRRFFVCYV